MHPAIIDRVTWDPARDVAAGHGASRDGDEPNGHPATRRFYPDHPRTVQAPNSCSTGSSDSSSPPASSDPAAPSSWPPISPATDAIAERDAQAVRLQARIKRIETAHAR